MTSNPAHSRAVIYFNSIYTVKEVGLEAVKFALVENNKFRDEVVEFSLNEDDLLLFAGDHVYDLRSMPSMQHLRALFDLARIHSPHYATYYVLHGIGQKLFPSK